MKQLRKRTMPWRLASLATALSLFVLAQGVQVAGAATIPPREEWVVRDASLPDGTKVEPGYQFKLINRYNGEMLVGKGQRMGIDLDFIPDPKNGYEGIQFVKEDNRGGPIRYGEKFAIYVHKGGYLKFDSRQLGNNRLVYRDRPVVEWKFAGGKEGTNVLTGQKVGLVNTTYNAYLVWVFQFIGINLGWIRIGP